MHRPKHRQLNARHGAPALLALSVVACSSSPTPDATCPAEASQTLLNASTEESYLGISEAQQRAVVQLVDSRNPDQSCSGVLLGSSWVLTAAHCDVIAEAAVKIRSGITLPSAEVPVSERLVHPRLDVALFRVDFAQASFGTEHPLDPQSDEENGLSRLGVLPIAVPKGTVHLAFGDAAVLAGFGVREDGEADALRFLTETVVAEDELSFTVGGGGVSGACDGDSGGPLLMRDEAGAVVVVGVLSSGSPTCLHDDLYLRTDGALFRDWLSSGPPLPQTDARPCGTITERGRCLYGAAHWCRAGRLVSEPCDATTPCGWDDDAAGFRCVAPPAPCAGVDAWGVCRGQVALTCDRGILTEEACGCSPCRIDGRTGQARCVE